MMKSIAMIAVLSLGVTACAKQEPALFNTYGVEKGAGSVGIHTVLPGDTVYTISKNYQLPMREIITLNKLNAPYFLNPGYRLKLPPPNEYKVRAGDSVEAIARMYEVSPNRLASLNGLQSPFTLTQGQVLRLPTPSGQYNIAAQPRVISLPNYSVAPTQTARVEPVVKSTLETPVGEPWSAKKAVETAPIPEKKVASVQTTTVTPAKAPVDQPAMSSSYKGVGKFMRPVDGQIISSYGSKKNGLHNDGVNIKAVKGTPVRAAENGVVVYNGDDLDGYGNLVLIRHENKMMSAYAHLDKTLIKRGAKVVRGQSIGTVGKTGQVDTPQLHFEIRKGSTPLNPSKYL